MKTLQVISILPAICCQLAASPEVWTNEDKDVLKVALFHFSQSEGVRFSMNGRRQILINNVSEKFSGWLTATQVQGELGPTPLPKENLAEMSARAKKASGKIQIPATVGRSNGSRSPISYNP